MPERLHDLYPKTAARLFLLMHEGRNIEAHQEAAALGTEIFDGSAYMRYAWMEGPPEIKSRYTLKPRMTSTARACLAWGAVAFMNLLEVSFFTGWPKIIWQWMR